MTTAQRAGLTRPAILWVVALAGLLAGSLLGAIQPARPVQALDRLPRASAAPSPGEMTVVVNAILYDVVIFVTDLPLVLNNAP